VSDTLLASNDIHSHSVAATGVYFVFPRSERTPPSACSSRHVSPRQQMSPSFPHEKKKPLRDVTPTCRRPILGFSTAWPADATPGRSPSSLHLMLTRQANLLTCPALQQFCRLATPANPHIR